MLFRSLLGMVLCELAAYLFLLLSLSTPYVAAAAIPYPVLSVLESSDLRTSWSLDTGPPGLPSQVAEVLIRSDTGTLIRTSGTREAEGAPSRYPSPPPVITGLIARQTTTGDPSRPTATDTSSSTAGQTTTFSQPRADPSATFSDPFPPEPLPTEDVEPIPPAPSVPETQTGVPTWAWGLGGAGIGLTVLLGLTRLLVFCSRKPQSE